MFHTILILAYLLPGIYMFFRTRVFFTKGRPRNYYSLVYIALFLIYPLSNLTGESGESKIGLILETISNYLLPFYLYFFLFILLFDLLLLINKGLKLMPDERIRRSGFRIVSFLAILKAAIIVVIAGIINFNTITATQYNLKIPSRNSDIKNLKVAFVSDFHLKSRTSKAFFHRFIRKMDEYEPDLVVFGGDIVEGDRNDGNLVLFENGFAGLKAKYGIYGVLGNHEHYSGQDKGNFFNKSGIKILKDTVITISNMFCLGGRSDSHVSDRKSISDLLKYADPELPLILADHRPTDIDSVSRKQVDVQLSGHTHNGQLFPINLITQKIYRISRGHEKIGNTDFYVSSGIRLWGPPVRTTGRSEILELNINFY